MFLLFHDELCSEWSGDQGAGEPHSGGIQRSLKITQENIQRSENGSRPPNSEIMNDKLVLESWTTHHSRSHRPPAHQSALVKKLSQVRIIAARKSSNVLHNVAQLSAVGNRCLQTLAKLKLIKLVFFCSL